MPLDFRIAVPLALALIAPGAQERSVWEKTLAPGVTFRMERQRDVPLDIYALRITPGSPGVELFPALTGKTVYDTSATFGRSTVSKMVAEHDGQAGVNADFFPLSRAYNSGDPLGLMVQDGQLVSGPYPTRCFFAWGPSGARIGYATLKGIAKPVGGTNFAIDGLNQDCPLNSVILNDEFAGLAAAKTPNAAAVLRVDQSSSNWGLVATATVESVSADVTRMPVPAGKFVLVGHGTDADRVASLKPGTRVEFALSLTGFDSAGMTNAIGGGPQLLKDGSVNVTAKEEGLPASFSEARHPRTAIGRSAAGDIWLVVTDGRSKVSRGASLSEMAEVMRNLGCTDAINLDGGGSSVMNILGSAVNRPSDGAERSVANGLVVRFPAALGPEYSVRVEGGVARALRGKEPVLDREIVWSARGPITVDQDGRITWIGAEGASTEDEIKRVNVAKAYVRATIAGRSVEIEVKSK